MRINILGFGITNQALVTLLNHYGISCDIYDDKFSQKVIDERGNALLPFSMIENNENLALISPGIPPSNPHLKYFKHIMSEYDFIYSLTDSIYSIWISGTNGKTTCTQMTSLMLNAKSGGNIGTPLSSLFMQDFPYGKEEFLHRITHLGQGAKSDSKKTKWILETSSFALHYTRIAKPNLYILLPVRQDHIDWHGSYENYIYDKVKILDSMDTFSFALIPSEILSYCSSSTRDIIENFRGHIYMYKDSSDLSRHFDIKYENFKEPFLLDFMLSAAGMKFAGLDFSIESIRQYKIDNYRIKERYIGNMLFVNDSKATNPHAVIAALSNYEGRNIYLIIGGDAKGADMSELYECLKGHKVRIFAIGKDGQNIHDDCVKMGIDSKYCATLRNAMGDIRACIEPESIIMLSPACASIDQYKSYKYRGDEFDLCADEMFAI